MKSSGQNIICNPGFETSDPSKPFPNNLGQAGDRLECWEDEKNDYQGILFHSPDWYHFNGGQNPYVMSEDIDGDGNFENILGRQNTNGYLGMGTCELIKQDTWNPGFVQGNGYVIHFYIRRPHASAQVTGGSFQSGFPGGGTIKIEVTLSKNGPHYKNIDEDCRSLLGDDCKDLDYNGLKQRLNLVELNINSLPFGEWIPVTVPYFTADRDYDYFTIQTIASSSEAESCFSYLLFDDFSVRQFESGLNELCFYPSQPNCSNCSATEGALNVSLVNNPLGVSTPLEVTGISNASSIIYDIYSNSSGLIQAPKIISCPNGWLNTQELSIPPGLAAANYYLRISTVNSCGYCYKKIPFSINANYSSGVVDCNCRALHIKAECCLNDYVAEKYDPLCSNLSLQTYHAIQNLTFGGSLNFSVETGDHLLAYAGNSITFLSDFETQIGGEMTAEVVPCTQQLLGNTGSDEIAPQEEVQRDATQVVANSAGEESSVQRFFHVYPNPSYSGVVFFKTNTSEPLEIKVFSLQGEEMYSGTIINGHHQVDAKLLDSGVFIVRYSSSENVGSARFIHVN